MANCHFKQDGQHIPTAVITGLDVESETNGGIIVNNSYRPEDTLGSWAVVGARVMITRFWSASSATVMLAPNLPSVTDNSKIIPLGLGLEEEFSIWMGYIDSLRPVTIDDLKEGRLLRVFTGVLENLKDTQTVQGISLMLQARDRAKWFLDSSIWFSAREIIAAQGTSRADLILDIANKSIGAVQLEDSSGYESVMKQADGSGNEIVGKVINKPEDPKYFVAPQNESDVNVTLRANAWYMGELEDPEDTVNNYDPLGSKLTSLLRIEPNPEFRIITTRVNLSNSTEEEAMTATRNAVQYLLAGNQPMEVLKALSFQEIYPMEIFQSHYDGNLYYVPRGNDSRGLRDTDKFNRRYYFKSELTDIDDNQRLIGLRTEVSSIGMKTNFLVSKQAPNTQETYDDYVLHLMTQPAVLRGKSYAPKLHKIYDPTIQSALDAALVSIALAKVWAREVDAGLTVMLGDPSIVPGEIIQVYGDINSNDAFKKWQLDNKDKTLKDYLDIQVNQFTEYDYHWNTKLEQLIALAQQQSTDSEPPKEISIPGSGSDTTSDTKFEFSDNSVEGPDETGEKVNEVLNNPSKVTTGDNLGFAEVPKTIFRVEAIIHKYNLGAKGFSTELALVSPF